jgi:hypothetical protein
MWDNPLRILILNTGYLFIIALCVYLSYLVKSSAMMLFVVIIFAVISLGIYSGITAFMTKEISDYKQPGLNDFIRFAKKSWKTGLIFSLIISAYLLMLSVIIPFYLNMNSIGGLIVIVFLVWISCAFILALQYYFVINARLENDGIKLIKKCFILFLDNPGFSVVLAAGSVIIIILSGCFGFLLPGFSTVSLWLNTGLKLRLFKYDYLAAHPENLRGVIPWNELIQDDYDAVGKRTLKGMIFPWKG